ncbi:cysteine-rich receptor-like protein kinase 5 [Gossypium australe]|uniref:Cysteine-rich receptor-like protein kinase 5 n=1 Tax=Gossypium australe TaxID=47621 RepID=A0A5B6VJN4_9ROSI|nr:cysteine-rich receptor-like protein kinase 5 [Gossypium australe]
MIMKRWMRKGIEVLFMHCCNVAHFKAAKRVLRYVKETRKFEVKFVRTEELKLLKQQNLNESQDEATKIKVDNQPFVAIAKNPMFHGKMKHFKIIYHFVREAKQSKKVNLIHCKSEDQFADILTKPFGTARTQQSLMEGVPDSSKLIGSYGTINSTRPPE